VTASQLPLNGRNVTNDVHPSTPAATAAAQDSVVVKKDLQIQRESNQAETLAGVSGRVTDRSGASISGATVTLRNSAGNTRQTTTSADGSFNLTELPAGQYELTAAASGFNTSKQSIELKPSELAMLKPMLDVGTTSEQVTVEAVSGALSSQTESTVVNGNVTARLPSMDRVTAVPSGLLVTATVSHGRRSLSIDEAGNLFLSRNGGKKWKKINPQWAGKPLRLELTPAFSGKAPPKAKNETLAPASGGAVFQLTTDAGAVWTSKDGAHWHQQ
jgi:hypothetical protein